MLDRRLHTTDHSIVKSGWHKSPEICGHKPLVWQVLTKIKTLFSGAQYHAQFHATNHCRHACQIILLGIHVYLKYWLLRWQSNCTAFDSNAYVNSSNKVSLVLLKCWSSLLQIPQTQLKFKTRMLFTVKIICALELSSDAICMWSFLFYKTYCRYVDWGWRSFLVGGQLQPCGRAFCFFESHHQECLNNHISSNLGALMTK